jgi:hypothetical protein
MSHSNVAANAASIDPRTSDAAEMPAPAVPGWFEPAQPTSSVGARKMEVVPPERQPILLRSLNCPTTQGGTHGLQSSIR